MAYCNESNECVMALVSDTLNTFLYPYLLLGLTTLVLSPAELWLLVLSSWRSRASASDPMPGFAQRPGQCAGTKERAALSNAPSTEVHEPTDSHPSSQLMGIIPVTQWGGGLAFSWIPAQELMWHC